MTRLRELDRPIEYTEQQIAQDAENRLRGELGPAFDVHFAAGGILLEDMALAEAFVAPVTG